MSKKTGRKKVLGRGLEALIPSGVEDEIYESVNERQIQNLDIEEVFANSFQPRKVFKKEELETLTESIKRNGVLQPILVRKVKNGYEIIAGERRWRSSKNAKLKTIPAIVMDLDEAKRYEIALIENIQRTDLSSIEEAEAYKTFIEKYGITQEEVGKRVGKSRTYITNTIRLLNLAPEIKDMLSENKISVGHSKILIPMTEKKQLEYAKIIIRDNLSVREFEDLIKQNNESKKKKKKTVKRDEKYMEVERELSELYGTKVLVKDGAQKGVLSFEFYSEEDFNRLYKLIKK